MTTPVTTATDALTDLIESQPGEYLIVLPPEAVPGMLSLLRDGTPIRLELTGILMKVDEKTRMVGVTSIRYLR